MTATTTTGRDAARASGGGVGVEDVVARVVLGPVGGLAEGQLVGGPRVRVAGGDHQDVARSAAGVEQQVDGFLGGVQRTLGRSRDQLDLRNEAAAPAGAEAAADGPEAAGAAARA